LLRRRHRDRAVLELVQLLVSRLVVVDVADRVAPAEPEELEEPAVVDEAVLRRLPRVL
jgi:hypothetical protein